MAAVERPAVEIPMSPERLAEWVVEARRCTIDLVADLTYEQLIGARLDITENSYKHTFEDIEAIMGAAGFRRTGQWLDERRYFSVNLLRPAE